MMVPCSVWVLNLFEGVWSVHDSKIKRSAFLTQILGDSHLVAFHCLLLISMAKYIPPRNFNMVTENIYRCITPTDLNYPFLERLNLKSIVYLSSNEMSESLYTLQYILIFRKLFFSDCGVRVYDISKSFGSEINELVVFEFHVLG